MEINRAEEIAERNKYSQISQLIGSHLQLLTAIDYDDEHRLRGLLGRGCNVNACYMLTKSPLHYATSKKKTGMVRVLVEAGACVSTKNSYGCTPLYIAAENGDMETVRYLLRAKKEQAVRDTLLHAQLMKNEQVKSIILKAVKEYCTQ